MNPWRKQFGIWVPDRSLSDERGFINAGAVGAIAGSRRRTAAATFDPDNYGTCTLWYKASEVTGRANGDSLTTADLLDYSDSGTADATAVASTKYQSDIGGYPAFQLDSARIHITLGNWKPAASTLFIVMRVNAGAGRWVTMGDNDSPYYTAVAENGSSSSSSGANFGTPTIYVNETSKTTRDSLYDAIVTGTHCVLCISGADFEDSGLVPELFGYSGAGWEFAGYVAEVVGYSSTLSSTNRDSCSQALRSKYGV